MANRKLEVGDIISVRVPDGTGNPYPQCSEVRQAKIRRIGAHQPEGNGLRIATLDIDGQVAYCVVSEMELADE